MTVVTLSVPHTPLGRSAPFWRGGRPGKEGLNHLPGRVKIHRWPMADCPVTNTFKVGYWRRSTPTAPVAEITTATAKALLGVKWSPKPPRRRAANELADYRCGRDAFIAELAAGDRREHPRRGAEYGGHERGAAGHGGDGMPKLSSPERLRWRYRGKRPIRLGR